MRSAALIVLLLFTDTRMLDAASQADPAATPIRYVVRIPEPSRHLIEVEATVPTSGRESIELMMPVWTPGSYLVREYARQVEQVEARTPGSATRLPVEKVRKNRWSISTGGASTLNVTYRVYARELSVQGNWVDASFALVNGAATFLTLADDVGPRPHDVLLHLPGAFGRAISALDSAPDGQPAHFLAPDFDTLVDCPIYAGNPHVYEFTVDGKPHYLVNEGETSVWDGPRSAHDVELIVRAQRDFWGFLPYDRYLFFNILCETSGGLEHKNSTVLMASRWATRRRPSYLGWLNLVSHEYFHTWNVKRLRPAELGPFDYESEVYTRSLWVAEGITSYFDRLFVRRAGLCTVDEFLAGDPPSPGASETQSKNDIERLQETPGRLLQPLESASLDAWIKYYRRDENTPNTAISYYIKGAVVAWLLDARIRGATNDAKSLDDVMRLAFSRFAGPRGFTPGEFRAIASEVANLDLADFFHQALETTDELDYAEALAWFGLRFAQPKPAGEENENPAEPGKSWLGLETKNEGGRLIITMVKRDTPGFDAGFNVGDEIVAIDELRVTPDQWAKRLEMYRPNDRVSFLLARRDVLKRIDATFASEPASRWHIEIDPSANERQATHRKAWLNIP